MKLFNNNESNKKKSAKKALALSAVSMGLSLAMLAGGTYAWFSDSESGMNIIKTGNLNVKLYHMDVNGNFGEVAEGTALFQKKMPDSGASTAAEGDDNPILWEPGVIATETFVVENAGNLAAAYDLYLGGAEQPIEIPVEGSDEPQLYYLSDHLKVAILPATASKSESNGEITATANADVTREYIAGTFLNGTWDGGLATQAKGDVPAMKLLPQADKQNGELLAGDVAAYTVVVYWEQSDEDNVFNGGLSEKEKEDLKDAHEVKLTINLEATQAKGDGDSIDSNYDQGVYDKDAYVTQNAFEKGADVNVSEDDTNDPFGG